MLFLWILRRHSIQLSTLNTYSNKAPYLAPFLFSVYINDLRSYISNSTGVGLFADDTKLYRCIKEPCDALALQEDIQSLHCWSDENHLRFNQSKCKVLSTTRKSSPLVNMYCLYHFLILKWTWVYFSVPI